MFTTKFTNNTKEVFSPLKSRSEAKIPTHSIKMPSASGGKLKGVLSPLTKGGQKGGRAAQSNSPFNLYVYKFTNIVP